MSAIRPGRPEDAAELVRLRRLMFTAMTGEDRPGPWEATAERMLRDALSLPPDLRRYGVFVVDADEAGPPAAGADGAGGGTGAGADGAGGAGCGSGGAPSGTGGTSSGSGGAASGSGGVGPVGGRLAACAVGTVEERLPAPGHPLGLFGFVFNVCTDPAHRGRGHARAVTDALLAWMAARGVTRVDLHATPDAERLYRSMGFAGHSVALSADLSLRRAED